MHFPALPETMPDWTTITLVIKESAGGDSFASHLYVDEEPVATNRTLPPTATQAQRELSDGYLSWFEQPQLPLVEEETLTTIGEQLFETWLADDWGDVEDELSPTDHRRFVVASDVPVVLNLPWSLLRLPGEDEPVGLDPTSSVRLHPATERLAESHDERRPGPLRVLYSACAPRDAVELGYEKEEYQLLQTLTQPDRDVAHFGCDLGAFDELQDRVREYRPHVVHLTGHGVVEDGKAHFAFEDQEGYTDLRPGDQIDEDERQEAHQAAGKWLVEVNAEDREEGHLNMHAWAADAEARSRFLDAENYDRARQITDRMSSFLVRRALYDDVVRLNEEMLEHERHPSPMRWLGRVHLERAEYEEARAKFEEALETYRGIGDRSGEASTRHSLAVIAAEQGDYEEARSEFEEVLEIQKEIGARAGEATTFGQLGNAASELSNTKGALRLSLLAFLIHKEIDHRHQQTAHDNVASLASELELSEGDLKEIAQEVAESYAEDRGWSLIQEAFPDADIPDDVLPLGDGE